MKPVSSSLLIRRQHGEAERPTRSATSATDSPASCCRMSSMRASTGSRSSAKAFLRFYLWRNKIPVNRHMQGQNQASLGLQTMLQGAGGNAVGSTGQQDGMKK